MPSRKLNSITALLSNAIQFSGTVPHVKYEEKSHSDKASRNSTMQGTDSVE